MEYFFIILFQVLGILANTTQKVYLLDKQYPEKSFMQIYGLFFENEWSSLSVSAIVLVLDVATHAVIDLYAPGVRELTINIPFIDLQVPYVIASFAIALVLGYAGQRLAYKYLGKAEEYLSNKVS